MFESVTVSLKEPVTLAAVPVSTHAISRGGCVLMPFVSLSCMPQNPPSSARSLCRIHPFSPIPKRRPNSSSTFCRLDAQLRKLASHCWLKIVKDRKKAQYFRLNGLAILMRCSGLGRIFRLTPQSLKCNRDLLHQQAMNELSDTFCSYFKSFFPKSLSLVCLAQATCWEAGCPAACWLCSLSISVRCHRTSTSWDLVNKNEVKPITFSTEWKYINVAAVIKLSLFSACLRDLLLTRKLSRIITRSVLHLCLLVFIQLFQLSGFVNLFLRLCPFPSGNVFWGQFWKQCTMI